MLLGTRVTGLQIGIVFSLVILVRAYDFFVHGGGMSGLGTSEYQMNISYAFFAVQSIVTMFRTAVLVWLYWRLEPKLNLVSAFALLEVIYTFFFRGRGELFITVILLFFVRTLKNPHFLTGKTLFAGTALIVFVIYAAFPAFLAFRDGYINCRDQGLGAKELFWQGLESLSQQDKIGGNADYADRLASRVTGTDVYLRTILGRQHVVAPMGGDAILAQLALVIPRFLWANKPTDHPETVIERYYGSSYGDPSSTTVSTGVADWGLLGGVFMGLIVGSYFLIGQIFAGRLLRISVLGGAVVSLALLDLATHYEVTMVSYWAVMRNGVIIGVLMGAMVLITKSGLRRRRLENWRHGSVGSYLLSRRSNG
jgi:hypothetical protein